MMIPATALVRASDAPFVSQSTDMASKAGRTSSASVPDWVSMRPRPRTRCGARSAARLEDDPPWDHPTEKAPVYAELGRQRERVAARIPEVKGPWTSVWP